MPRLLLTLPALLLLPDVAYAAPDAAESLLATIIAYSKSFLFVIGIAQIVRIVFISREGRPVSGAIWTLAGTIIIPVIFLAVLDTGGGTPTAGPAHAAGRPFIEFTLAQIGLINASSLWGWDTFQLLFLSIVFAAMATVFLRAQAARDDEQGWKEIKSWTITSILIFAIFQPGWTTPGAATSADVIAKISGQKAAASAPPPAGSVGPSDALVADLSRQNFRLTRSSQPEIPTILALINEAMDNFIGELAVKFATESFGRYGLIHSRQMLSSLNFSLPDKAVDSRFRKFIWDCWAPKFLRQTDATAGGPNKSNLEYFNPFSSIYLPSYNGNCKAELRGKPEFPGGKKLPPLRDAVLGNLAFSDAGQRDFYGWKSPAQAVAMAPKLRRLLYNNVDSKLNYQNLENVLMARVTKGSFARSDPANMGYAGELIQRQRTQTNDNWFSAMASMFGGQGFALVENAKGAAANENLNLRMPIFFGLLQALLLSVFPLFLAMAMIPGRASWLGYYLSTLLWSKSYIVGWALISQLDQVLSSMALGTAQELAVINVIQSAQMYTPIALALVVFGPSVAVQSLSRGGGAA